MSLGELAAFVCSYLKNRDIHAILSGGGCVSIYTTNQYQSFDLDFVENHSTSRRRIKEFLAELGFYEENRYFKHPETVFFVEFPPGPLAVGNEPVKEILQMEFATGQLLMISPTDCVKDRLAGYYHWDDQQCLEQALLVAESRDIDIEEIERWSGREGKEAEFSQTLPYFQEALKKRKDV